MKKFLDGNGLKYLWGKIRAAVELKQDRLTGQTGQVVGFDEAGNAAALAASDAGLATTEQVNASIGEAIQSAILDSWEAGY